MRSVLKDEERRFTDRIPFGQKKFGEVGAILTGHASDESDLAGWTTHECTRGAVAFVSSLAIEDTRTRLKVIVSWMLWRLRSNAAKMAATNAKSGWFYANRHHMSGGRATLEQHIALCEGGEEAGENAI
jgi:hypothetical protein